MQFDSVRIHVADLDAATREYELLLGFPASSSDGLQRFQLGRGAVELAQGEPELHSLRFTATVEEAATWPSDPAAFNGLRVSVESPRQAAAPARGIEVAEAIDHVVIHSPNLDRVRALWRDRLGLRLALDREFPGRGLRMLFFRSGGVTLEFVGTLAQPGDPSGPDRLYGIAYRVPDIEACRARLLRAGFDLSAIRTGHKPGTSVATVHTGTTEIPTLLLSAT